MKKNKQKEFIENFRWKIYDCFLATVNDIGKYKIGKHKYEAMLSGNRKQIWVYDAKCTTYGEDGFNGYRIITFPVDLLYINFFKGCSNFYYYVRNRLEE